MKKQNSCRLLALGLFSILLLAVLAAIWHFTSQNGQASHAASKALAENLRDFLAGNAGRQGHSSLNILEELIRKLAHFFEYFLLGAVLCAFLNVLFRRVWPAAAVALAACPLFAYVDEYRQNFIFGRNPRWFDWKVDVAGAVLGILLAAVLFLVFRYIQKLKARIKELEEKQG